MGKVWGKILKGCLTALLVVGMIAVNTVNVSCTEGTFFSSSETDELTRILQAEAEAAGYHKANTGGAQAEQPKNTSNATQEQKSNAPVKTCEHHYVDEIIKAPTCVETGIMESKCSKCGATNKTEIPATGEHLYESEVTKEATCVEEGVTTYTCEVCGDTYEEAIPLTEHDYDSVVAENATCTQPGTRAYICNICDDSYTEEIPASGHVYTETSVVKESGLFTTGIEEIRCTDCMEVLSTAVIPSKYPRFYLYIGIAIIGIMVIAGIVFWGLKKNKEREKEKLEKSA